ncbi:hypothetical protein AMR72_07140 [Flavobacterium psychrophilum]|nr:hypothetical protein AMR72_07140 [Flavobacterium psychrophilum]AOE52304.1 hypothetical protein ALW18_07130 [Flavobacterium psychrophilum]
MKRILQRSVFILIALPLLFSVLSCSGDGDNEAESLAQIIDVKYKLVVDRSVVTKITYSDPTGALVEAPEEYQSLLTWEKPITVEMPFEATLKADFVSTPGIEVHYDMYIYLNGVEARHQEGVVAPETSVTISYYFNAK